MAGWVHGRTRYPRVASTGDARVAPRVSFPYASMAARFTAGVRICPLASRQFRARTGHQDPECLNRSVSTDCRRLIFVAALSTPRARLLSSDANRAQPMLSPSRSWTSVPSRGFKSSFRSKGMKAPKAALFPSSLSPKVPSTNRYDHRRRARSTPILPMDLLVRRGHMQREIERSCPNREVTGQAVGTAPIATGADRSPRVPCSRW